MSMQNFWGVKEVHYGIVQVENRSFLYNIYNAQIPYNDQMRNIITVQSFSEVMLFASFLPQILIISECVIILAVHNYCHPYLRSRANLAESVYLLVLCALAIMQIIDEKQVRLDVLVEVLLLVMACHTLVVFLCKAPHFFRNRFHCACVRSNRSTRRRGYDELKSTETEQSLSIETQRRRSNLDTISQTRSQGLSSSRPPGTRLTISDSFGEGWEHAGQY